eukprot:1584574-Prymnesium_polylepis.1
MLGWRRPQQARIGRRWVRGVRRAALERRANAVAPLLSCADRVDSVYLSAWNFVRIVRGASDSAEMRRRFGCVRIGSQDLPVTLLDTSVHSVSTLRLYVEEEEFGTHGQAYSGHPGSNW